MVFKYSTKNKKSIKSVAKVAEKMNCSEKKAKKIMDEAKERIGVSYKDYCNLNFHKLTPEEQAIKYKRTLAKREHVKNVANKMEINQKDARTIMQEAKNRTGVSYKDYDKYNFHLLSFEQQKDKAERLKRKKSTSHKITDSQREKNAARIQMKEVRKNEAFDNISSCSGLDKNQILSEIKRINARGIKKINVFFYEKFQMYNLSDEELDKKLILLNKRDSLAVEIKDDIKELDEGIKTFSDVEPKIDSFRETVKILMTPVFRQKLVAIYNKGRIHEDGKTIDDVLVDMEVTRLLLGFSFTEYMAFNFDSKDFLEKRTYISNKERMAVLRYFNEEMSCDLLNDKSKCYEILKEYFGREQVYIRDMGDLDKFKKFCHKRKCFVKKPLAKSMGKGIEPVYINKKTEIAEMLSILLDEAGSFIAEDMIMQHKVMKKLNPSSVNTVRLETFFDGEKVRIIDAFIRCGQKGAFVDNGGAGGILAAVDPEKGIIISNGFDEYGKTYAVHPQSGVSFKGYHLKDWNKALELAESIGNKFPGVKFIGWDLAYTRSKKWIVVEGNAKPQIIGNQSSQGRGLKRTFLEKTNYVD